MIESKIALITLVAFCALIGATGQIFFKQASADISTDIKSWIYNYKLMIGITLYAIATIFFVAALKYGNLSILYPIIATSYIWVALFSKVFLHEPFPAFKWIGILLIIAGVGIVAK
ncbi:MAG: EamA family transporter [archaeon]|nr:EamA family transporter [archaeon]